MSSCASRSRRFGGSALALATMAAVLAACSGGGDAVPIETTTSSSVPSTTTSTSAPTTTTETVPDGPIAPLTGLVEATSDLERPALALKVDNHPDAGSQVGLDQADLVFESRAEGVTRFLAVFHSQMPDEVGPIRSSRTSDFDLLSGLDRPLYGSSGGNAGVLGGLRRLDIVAVTAASETVYYRESGRRAPHNLMVDPAELYALAPDETTAPDPWFSYRSAEDELPATAAPTTGAVSIDFRGSPLVTHTWDAVTGGWTRTENGAAHTMSDGTAIAPENVVVLVTRYISSSADRASPELVSVGSGDLYVLTAGAVIEGTWTRDDPSESPTLLDLAGEPILLTPGRTWVLYPEAGTVTLP